MQCGWVKGKISAIIYSSRVCLGSKDERPSSFLQLTPASPVNFLTHLLLALFFHVCTRDCGVNVWSRVGVWIHPHVLCVCLWVGECILVYYILYYSFTNLSVKNNKFKIQRFHFTGCVHWPWWLIKTLQGMVTCQQSSYHREGRVREVFVNKTQNWMSDRWRV